MEEVKQKIIDLGFEIKRVKGDKFSIHCSEQHHTDLNRTYDPINYVEPFYDVLDGEYFLKVKGSRRTYLRKCFGGCTLEREECLQKWYKCCQLFEDTCRIPEILCRKIALHYDSMPKWIKSDCSFQTQKGICYSLFHSFNNPYKQYSPLHKIEGYEAHGMKMIKIAHDWLKETGEHDKPYFGCLYECHIYDMSRRFKTYIENDVMSPALVRSFISICQIFGVDLEETVEDACCGQKMLDGKKEFAAEIQRQKGLLRRKSAVPISH